MGNAGQYATCSFFQTSKTTFKRILENQIPIDYDNENYEYDDENGDNYEGYDDNNNFQLPWLFGQINKYTPF